MKPRPTFLLLALLGAFLPAASAVPNELTATERADGWRLLFNGTSLDGWRGFRQSAPPTAGWEVRDGVLTCVKGGKGGDIVTTAQFDDFELSWEWRMPAQSNNGVKYFITEARTSAIGHEYQMIDDTLVHGDALSSTGSFYLVVAPDAARKHVRPFGEWNHSRIVVQGNRVEHWLNGERLLAYEPGSPAVLDQVRKTKFKDVAGFGKKLRGHLLLTYHQDECSFRNIKVREFGGAR